MKYSFKRPLMLKILFILSSIFTVGFLSVMIWTLLIGPEVLPAVKMISGMLRIDTSAMFAIILGIVLIQPLKWLGVFSMFGRKPWGYILFIIPNLLFLGALVPMLLAGVTTLELISFVSVTFIMIVLYTIELFCLRSLRRKERSDV